MFGTYIQRRMKRLVRNKDGATAVEFGMVALPFFFLLFAIMEASLHFFAGQLLESAVDSAARQMRTGQFSGTGTVNDFRELLAANVSGILNADDMNIDVRTAAAFDQLGGPPQLDDEGNVDKDAYRFSVPSRKVIAMVTVTYEWPIITNFMQASLSNLSNGNALLSATAVFKTEAF